MTLLRYIAVAVALGGIGAQAHAETTPFSSTEYGFEAGFPNPLKLQIKEINDEKQIAGHGLVSFPGKLFLSVDAGLVFAIQVTSFPSFVLRDLKPEEVFDEQIAGLIRGRADGKIMTSRDATLHGMPGRSVKIALTKDGHAKQYTVQTFLAGTRLFMVFVFGHSPTEVDQVAIERFLSSFKLDPQP